MMMGQEQVVLIMGHRAVGRMHQGPGQELMSKRQDVLMVRAVQNEGPYQTSDTEYHG